MKGVVKIKCLLFKIRIDSSFAVKNLKFENIHKFYAISEEKR